MSLKELGNGLLCFEKKWEYIVMYIKTRSQMCQVGSNSWVTGVKVSKNVPIIFQMNLNFNIYVKISIFINNNLINIFSGPVCKV